MLYSAWGQAFISSASSRTSAGTDVAPRRDGMHRDALRPGFQAQPRRLVTEGCPGAACCAAGPPCSRSPTGCRVSGTGGARHTRGSSFFAFGERGDGWPACPSSSPGRTPRRPATARLIPLKLHQHLTGAQKRCAPCYLQHHAQIVPERRAGSAPATARPAGHPASWQASSVSATTEAPMPPEGHAVIP